jgi:predicted enzyme related to lactoylglutathione lyase
MSLKLQHVTFDCAAPRLLAEFWAGVVGGVIAEDWGEFVTVNAEDAGLRYLAFGRVPETKEVKNRVHLDLVAEDRRAEVARLGSLGARVVIEERTAPGIAWTVMQDPEGNEFCVTDPR